MSDLEKFKADVVPNMIITPPADACLVLKANNACTESEHITHKYNV